MRLPSIAFAAGLLRLTQARTNGGSAETEEIALTVMPQRPSGPSVVTTETAVAAPPMAALNCSGDMCCMSGLSCEEHASRDDKGKIDYMTYLDWLFLCSDIRCDSLNMRWPWPITLRSRLRRRCSGLPSRRFPLPS